ncbi:MAG: 50S ribosomal protein L10 [candidate division SR1 bacterium]|nr:50S ribosomal protein L10 [candidate division SR1 bacterium]
MNLEKGSFLKRENEQTLKRLIAQSFRQNEAYKLFITYVEYKMAITKAKKVDLIKQYIQDLKDAKSTVIVRQTGISVSTATRVRKDVLVNEGKLNVVRKRLFLRALKDAGLEEVTVDQLDGAIFALYANENEFGPLKAVNKYLKEFKAENKGAEFSFVGGWFEKKRQSGEYVSELANVPSKEESLAKLCYLFNYPLSSLACVISEVAKKNGAPVEEKREEVKAEEAAPVESGEVKVEEVKAEETPTEEVKAEEAPAVEETPAEEAKAE